MNARIEYGGENLDQLFCFFMRTILRIQKNGTAEIPIDVTFGQPIDVYLKTAVSLIENAQPPEIFHLILQTEYDQISAGQVLTRQQTLLLLLIKEFSWHIQFDEDRSEYLLSTVNLWNDTANAYACKTFYVNLPLETKKREGLDFILNNMPASWLEPDSY